MCVTTLVVGRTVKGLAFVSVWCVLVVLVFCCAVSPALSSCGALVQFCCDQVSRSMYMMSDLLRSNE